MYLVLLLLLKHSWLSEAEPIVSIKGTLAARRANPAFADSSNTDQGFIITANPPQNQGAFFREHDTDPVAVTQNTHNSPGSTNRQGTGPVSVTQTTYNSPGSIGQGSQGQGFGDGSYGSQDSWSQGYSTQQPYSQQGSFGRGNGFEHGYNYGSHGYSRRYSYHGSYGSGGFTGFPGSFSRHSFSRSFDPYSQGNFGSGFDLYTDALKPKSRSKRSGRLLDGIIRGIKKDIFHTKRIIGVPVRVRVHRRNNQESVHSASHNKQILGVSFRGKQVHRRNNQKFIHSASQNRHISVVPPREESVHRRNNQGNVHSASHNKQILEVSVRGEGVHRQNNPEFNHSTNRNKQIGVVPPPNERQKRPTNPENIHSGSQDLLQGIINGIRRDMFNQNVNLRNVARNPARVQPILNNVVPRQNPNRTSQPVTTLVPPTSSAPVVGTPRK